MSFEVGGAKSDLPAENAMPQSPKSDTPDTSITSVKSAFLRAKPTGAGEPSTTKFTLGKRGGPAAKRIESTTGPILRQRPPEAARLLEPHTSDEMKARIQRVEKSLHTAQYCQTVDERLEHTPQIPSAKGIAGSYFVGGKQNPELVVKPILQEPGMPGTLEESAYPSIRPGTGAIRERMAYILQEATGISFGVPETTLHQFSHEMLGLRSETTTHLQVIKEVSGISITREKVVELIRSSPDGSFCGGLQLHLQTLLEKQVPNAITRQKWLKIASDKDMSFVDLRRHIISKDVAKVVFGLSRLSHDRQQLEQAAASVYKNLSEPSAQPRKGDLCSAQKMETGCISLDALAYGDDQTEIEHIPQVELEKFLVDCILFNMDRHLGNALARKITLNEIASRIPGASEAERERLLALEQHGKNIGSTYVYELILIDHGTTIPEQKFSDLTAKMEWRALDQTEKPLSATTKRRILELDPAAVVQKVREDQSIFEAKFGSFCSVSNEAYSFMRFCCILLQEGVRQDKTLYELAEIYENLEASGLLAIYDKSAQAKEAEEWISIQKSISEIIATQGKEQ